MMQDGNRESVTVIETISADGRVLPPFIIWKAKVHLVGWYKTAQKKDGATFAISPKGYTDNELGQEYLIKCFEPMTRER